ncbi:MAG: HAMP domain-containing histidine kinase [Firmicutes bacterium]|nr:HAMP domain-containing histidine kinase [Bacillota bacterium]
MGKLSITKKITIWYTIFMLFITGCVLWTLVYTGNLRASEAAQEVLMEAVADASEEIERFGGDFVVDDKLKFYEDGVYISIYDGEGELIEGRVPGELVQIMPVLDDKEIATISDGSGEAWYVYDSLFEVDDKFVWVRGVVKDFAEQSTFTFIMRLAGIAFPGLVIAAALGGYIITRRAFRPVRDIIETVEDITADGDLSRRVRIEEEHVETNDEIYKLAGTFNEMFNKLEKTFEQEKQFTSDVSHELRTPLAVIISQSDYAMEDEEYREKALGKINKEARRMSTLVNRLLTLSRSDSGRLVLEKDQVDLSEVCEMVAEQQVNVAEDKNISIETDIAEDITITGDEAMIMRILLNLMDNAVKYGREDGKVTLSLTEENGYAVCSVEDDGIGISEEDLEKIWERFYRVEASRSEEGAGLGLVMVAALTKAHGGSVDVTSKLGEGSRFIVKFPIYIDKED